MGGVKNGVKPVATQASGNLSPRDSVSIWDRQARFQGPMVTDTQC